MQLEDLEQQDAIANHLLSLDGITEVYDRAMAAKKLELAEDRIGDLTVLCGRNVVVGRTPADHDLSVLKGGLRSHGGRYEEMVPSNAHFPDAMKKAMKKRGISRTRRGNSGIVTPPFGSSFTMTSRDLITYDDEYNQEKSSSSDIVSDVDDSVAEEARNANSPETDYDKDMLVAPVLDIATVKHISSEISTLQSIMRIW